MKNLEYHLDRIATALESISQNLNLSLQADSSSGHENNFLSTIDTNFITHSPVLPEEELFINTTKIYLDETKRKFDEGLQRKSAVKVSQNLIPMQINFLEKHLPNMTAYEHSNAVFVLNQDQMPKALIRVYTDLGFHRADHWKKDISNITNIATELSISHENIFLIVISNLNGLDNNSVCALLDTKISNKEILDPVNIDKLKEYNNLYIQTFRDILPNPKKQIYFLTGRLHPNVVAEDLFSNNNLIFNLKKYMWISTPLRDIFNTVKRL
ncbi:hypothetical protein GCM10007216_30660 [Thalassobacillus devorans]|uniref:Uncharacterized protein n=1 Tax=Thalassobacillus devorans TaxID=279813 RepID=A0ABQ1PIJ8_9BACI|nr:hypothetical protein [Thalassobacillus devorans]NIK30026.1 hypothetical protein [Thalassobacillus devorans]GGC97748.1 hypothetical protein GCM10007216_30660 [Thalassobacillus devorans]